MQSASKMEHFAHSVISNAYASSTESSTLPTKVCRCPLHRHVIALHARKFRRHYRPKSEAFHGDGRMRTLRRLRIGTQRAVHTGPRRMRAHCTTPRIFALGLMRGNGTFRWVERYHRVPYGKSSA